MTAGIPQGGGKASNVCHVKRQVLCVEGQECKAQAASIAFDSHSLADDRGRREARGLGRKQYFVSREPVQK